MILCGVACCGTADGAGAEGALAAGGACCGFEELEGVCDCAAKGELKQMQNKMTARKQQAFFIASPPNEFGELGNRNEWREYALF